MNCLKLIEANNFFFFYKISNLYVNHTKIFIISENQNRSF